MVGSFHAACAEAGLVWPLPGPGIGDVLAGAGGALGCDDPQATAAQQALALPAADRVVVVMVDGMGRTNLAERAGHAPFLRRLLPGSLTLSSTFPSTTATALGAFGTGAPPGATGMLGYTVLNPATGALANLVSWTGVPPAEQWQRQPTWFERLVAGGMTVTSVGPQRFDGSGLTQAVLRGARYVPAETLAQRVDQVVAAARSPGLVYLYWGEVDKTGHQAGPGSLAWGEQLGAADAELARLARSLRPGTLLVITADHGMLDIDPAARWDVATSPELARGVALVTGEPRAMHLHVEDGTDPQQVVTRWREVLGANAVVVPKHDALAAGVFGPVDAHVAPAIGDVVVAMARRATVADTRTQTAESLLMLGVHGSLTEHETAVPLLVTLT
ncbi:MAG: alkaline phosphatase family protein [Micrococcales bacterium]|nr:alkaline phosphatase family protein [Micrococcales bacterium]